MSGTDKQSPRAEVTPVTSARGDEPTEPEPEPTEPEPPVYDERGNVRPRGTKGAKPMTYAERVASAARLAEDSK